MRLFAAGFFVLYGLWGGGCLGAQTVTITGERSGYEGKSIYVTIPGNPFLDIPRFAGKVICDQKGAFTLAFETTGVTVVRLATSVYDASIYTEPGHHYHIQLPAYKEMAYAERISPYFEPYKIPLRLVGNPLDVNHEIYRFDSLFSHLNEQLIHARRVGEELPVDSIIGVLAEEFKDAASPWFDNYRRYKSGILKLNSGRAGLEEISRDYLGERVNERHPAYMELFGAMFRDFLIYYDRTPEGKGIRYHINRTHNLDSLRSVIASHPAVTNDTLRDLILLQELPTLFYRGDFHKEAILILFDSLEADPVKALYGEYAKQIGEKLSSLVIGNPPPHFSLPGTDGKIYTPLDFLGKYTYLMFATPDHYGCMMEYPFLQSYLEKHDAYLEVLTIMVAEKEEQVKAFMERNQYGWKALYYDEQVKMLSDYLVKAFPVAYLIGPDGKLILSPAPLPSDGFEQQLFRIMRSRGDI
ncbi:MAG: TlpA disulfide reductase family protein [Bacteroidota bacterium]